MLERQHRRRREGLPRRRGPPLRRESWCSGGRNLVAKHAKGDILVFVDDDTEAAPDLLTGIRRRFATDQQLVLVALRIDDPKTGQPRSHEFPALDKHLKDRVFQPTYFVGAGFAIRRHNFEAIGGFDASLWYSLEELDLSFRLAASEARFLYDPELQVVHHAAGAGVVENFERVVGNRWRVVARHLPARMAISHVLLWTGVLLMCALRHGRFDAWLAGVCAGCRGLAKAIREREPLPAAAVARLRRQHGRLWF